jgi:hypothetical protein
LTEPVSHKATLFTLRDGAIPIFTTSYYCHGTFRLVKLDFHDLTSPSDCHFRYYHNYRVHKATSKRMYYGSVPEYIQVAQHYFFEADLLEFFANAMVFGWYVKYSPSLP